jgi:hypothetical protein
VTSVFTFAQLGGQFCIWRHYFRGICASWVAGSDSSLIDNVWKVQGVFGGVTTYQEFILYPPFLEPSSNRYTPDHVVLDHYYVNLPSMAHINPLPIDVTIRFKPGTRNMYLSLDSLNFPDFYYLDLDPPTPVWP